MAGAYISTNSELAQKKWRPGVTHEAERQCLAMGFVSGDDDSVVVLLEDLTKERGDKIQIRFSPTEEQAGFRDEDDVEGHEREVNTVKDEIAIDYQGFAWKTRSVMSQQRVNFDQKKQIFVKAGKLWKRRYEECFFNQLAGFTPAMGATQDDYRKTGHNAVVAPDAQHIYRPGATTDDESMTGIDADRISLSHLTAVLARAMSKDEITWPITPGPDGLYHCIVSTRQWKRLREDSNPGEWQDVERAKMEGGKAYEKTGFYGSFLGIWNNIALHVSDYVTKGVDSGDATLAVDDVDRAIFLGSRAGHWAYGEGYASGDHLDWTEQTRDYKKWGILVDSVFGFKTTIFPDESGDTTVDRYYGCIVIPTFEGADA